MPDYLTEYNDGQKCVNNKSNEPFVNSSIVKHLSFNVDEKESKSKVDVLVSSDEPKVSTVMQRSIISDCPSTSTSLGVMNVMKDKVKQKDGVKVDGKNVCDVCGKQCQSPADLKTHMLIHTNEKPFACDQCSYRCNELGNLNKHIQIKHSNEKPFCCDQCDYKCVLLSHLKRHKRIHTGEKPFKCSYCEMRFNQVTNMRKHIKNIHGFVNQFNCVGSCSESFATIKLLRKHQEVCEISFEIMRTTKMQVKSEPNIESSNNLPRKIKTAKRKNQFVPLPVDSSIKQEFDADLEKTINDCINQESVLNMSYQSVNVNDFEQTSSGLNGICGPGRPKEEVRQNVLDQLVVCGTIGETTQHGHFVQQHTIPQMNIEPSLNNAKSENEINDKLVAEMDAVMRESEIIVQPLPHIGVFMQPITSDENQKFMQQFSNTGSSLQSEQFNFSKSIPCQPNVGYDQSILNVNNEIDSIPRIEPLIEHIQNTCGEVNQLENGWQWKAPNYYDNAWNIGNNTNFIPSEPCSMPQDNQDCGFNMINNFGSGLTGFNQEGQTSTSGAPNNYADSQYYFANNNFVDQSAQFQQFNDINTIGIDSNIDSIGTVFNWGLDSRNPDLSPESRGNLERIEASEKYVPQCDLLNLNNAPIDQENNLNAASISSTSMTSSFGYPRIVKHNDYSNPAVLKALNYLKTANEAYSDFDFSTDKMSNVHGENDEIFYQPSNLTIPYFVPLQPINFTEPQPSNGFSGKIATNIGSRSRPSAFSRINNTDLPPVIQDKATGLQYMSL